jgi:hypothetical protein
MVYAYGYRQINPTKSVSYTNFVGNVDFEFSTNQLEYLDFLETYCQVRLRIEQNSSNTTATGTCLTPVSVAGASDFIPFLCKNPCASLFSNGNMYINGKIVSAVTEISSGDTLIRSCFESKEIMNSIDSTNPIYPQSIEDTIINDTPETYGLAGAQDFTKSCPYSGRNLYAWNNMGAFKYYKENEMIFTPQLPLFSFGGLNPNGLPPGNKIKISLYASPYYNTSLIQSNRQMTTTTPITNIVQLSQSNGTLPPNTIGVAVIDIFLQVRMITKPNPMNDVKILKIRQIQTQTHTIASKSEQFPLSFPIRNLKYILASFLKSSRYGLNNSSTDFSDGITPSGTVNITGAVSTFNLIRFTYHGKSYPSTDYNIINTNKSICGNGDSSMELYRLYADLVGNSGSRADRSGSIYNLSRISIEPIMCFKVSDLPNNMESSCNITINCSNPTYTSSQSALLIVCLFDNDFEIPYLEGNVDEMNCRLVE